MLLILLLTVTASFHHCFAAYTNRGAGICAQTATPTPDSTPTDDIYEYTRAIDVGLSSLSTKSEKSAAYTEAWTLQYCQQFCDNATVPVCLGVSYYYDADVSVTACLFHGNNSQANFTAHLDGSFGAPTNIDYDASSGSATTGVFVDDSGWYSSSLPAAIVYTCYEKLSEASAFGDPHITSVHGCKLEVPHRSGKELDTAVLMQCEDESLEIGFRTSWKDHISRVDIHRKGGVRERFKWGALSRSQHTKVCGNTIEFHRYHLGISVHMKHVDNFDFTGLFADNSCL